MKLFAIPALLLAALISTPAQAKLKVFACEPEWGSLVNELAGDKVEVSVGTSALQDVHQIEAKPSLIAKVRSADLMVCTGAELEVGWLPQLIRQSGNSKVASGAGSFMAAAQVKTLEKPTALDRAYGDVHPDGNPHVQMDPRRVLVIAKALDARLAQLDPANAAAYQQRLDSFTQRWLAAMAKWKAQAAPLRGRNVVVHHISWVYLWDWLGIKQVGALEPKPGVPPTSAHLASLIATTKGANTLAIVRAAYQDGKPSEWLSGRTGVPAVSLPFTVGGDAQSKDLFGLFDSTISKLLGASNAGAAK
ncbi:zinc ABC transporter substrate-binding protein [Lysobacter sp. Root494]|uniref:metal ABC transporter substrate-binding protein n=1 Tax=Lysobacter sp. Root494 TaxID=1736549 RepID=UPI0006F95272|nr:zinc ABC transporter substrate-binding protein [Lysobacter sp. Root494]KQY51733.1 zinc ABC transporter substrate-binding protein [Lysobacter sp. Root494]